MGHIRQCIGLLRLGQRASRPVGETRRFIHLLLDYLAHQSLIAHLLAKAADHCRDLRIKQRRWENFSIIPENLEILTRRMEHFHDRSVAKQAVERLKRHIRRQRIDQNSIPLTLSRNRHLQQAKLRIVGPLSEKFSVYGDIGMALRPRAKGVELGLCGQCLHGLSGCLRDIRDTIWRNPMKRKRP